MNVLDEVGGEMIPNRRITADSFRLLTARLKKRPPAFVQPELLPEPAILNRLKSLRKRSFRRPLPRLSRRKTTLRRTSNLPRPRLLRKSPGPGSRLPIRWKKPSAVDLLFETEAPVQAAEEAKPAAEREPWQIPFEELFATPAITEPEPEAVLAEPELGIE